MEKEARGDQLELGGRLLGLGSPSGIKGRTKEVSRHSRVVSIGFDLLELNMEVHRLLLEDGLGLEREDSCAPSHVLAVQPPASRRGGAAWSITLAARSRSCRFRICHMPCWRIRSKVQDHSNDDVHLISPSLQRLPSSRDAHTDAQSDAELCGTGLSMFSRCFTDNSVFHSLLLLKQESRVFWPDG